MQKMFQDLAKKVSDLHSSDPQDGIAAGSEATPTPSQQCPNCGHEYDSAEPSASASPDPENPRSKFAKAVQGGFDSMGYGGKGPSK